MVPQNGHPQGRPQQQTQQAGFQSFQSPTSNMDSPSFLLDSPQVAKQMAALTAANQARIAQNTRMPPSSLQTPGGTSSGPYLGGINSHSYPPGSHELLSSSANGHANFQMPNNNYGLPQTPNSATNASFLDPSMSQPNPSRNQPPTSSLKQRQHGFLQGLAGLMAKKGTPLPPSLTGIPSLNYDPNNSPWSIIESSTEVGSFRLAGKDVDLFKLWGLVFQSGGGPAVNNAKGWGAFLHHFDLPEHFSEVQSSNSTEVAFMLSQYYMAILYPFEEMYKKNIQEQQKKAQLSQRQGSMPGQQFPNSMSSGRPGPGMPNIQQQGMRPTISNGLIPQAMPPSNGLTQYPQIHNQNRPSSSQNPHQISASDSHNSLVSSEIDPLAHTLDSNLLDQDIQGIKRKHDQEDRDMKRVRQKTDPPEGNSMLISMNADSTNNLQVRQASQPPPNPSTTVGPRQQPSRRKIEYVPLARDAQSFGGRDLQAIDAEWHNVVPKRPLRDINDWGVVDIECLCMSIRSRLSIELSYALTTFTVLSTMRGQTSGSGFPIYQCPDLLDDALDLMEELAFGDPEKAPSPDSAEVAPRIITNRDLVALVQDSQCRPFASLESHQGSKDPKLGPQQRPGNVVLAVVNILRNLCMVNDNVEFIANHPRLVDILLRLSVIEQSEGKPPSPASKIISLSDLLVIRRDTMNILMCIAGLINLANNSPSPTTLRMARRAFELCASYLVDPAEASPPLASVQLAGVPPNVNRRPPAQADIALEVLTRFSQVDSNRQVITKAMPQATIWLLLTSLVHRLPIVDADFLLMQREYWLGFVEKLVMAIYSLVFLAPYELKQKIKTDRTLAFKNVMLRMAQKVLSLPNHDGRTSFSVSARRAVETMKLLDKAEEFVDTSEPTMPVLSFGMGFSDGSDSGMEKGTGMLGGNREAAWEMLMMRDVLQDDILFNELDSMVRVECL
ncbi:hypothetical protein GALMADRAFT_233788 [Galerina marginata CBS 339.88]|uniref:ARID domain-containing protein n=1 Tax=Galerina marginata (strain CBS 339.88) TaxID=685588 RepID=A0A067TPN9_GALM3|nr:hypothetical protein GALMADRAFT_233788 [Galerina marginata CBS 339.88]